jgi:hypothetical protein
VLDTATLYATLAFCNGDIAADAREYAKDILPHMPTDRLRVDAAGLMSTPSLQMAASLAQSCLEYLQSSEGSQATGDDYAAPDDALCRADLYAAAWGHLSSCYRAAGHAYTYAHAETNLVLHARYTAVALGLLGRAQEYLYGFRPDPVTADGWVDDATNKLRTTTKASGEYTAARVALTFKELKAAKEDKKADPIEDMLSDMPDAPDVDTQADLEALLAVADPTPVIAAPEPPTLVVLQSVNHLPEIKSQQYGNPRAEYGSMAGVAMPLAETPDLHQALRILVAEMPWAKDVITTVLMDSVGSPASRVRPTLLVGRPGSGKTRLARRLGEVLGMQPTVIPAAGVSDSSFGGTSRQYSSGRASVPLQAVKRTGIANPMLILDELEKAATGTYNGRLTDVLVPYLERESSCRLQDPYLEIAVDLGAVGWVGSANDLFMVPGPLLDRFRILEVSQPRKQDLPVVVRTIMVEIRADQGMGSAWLPDLDPGELEIVAKQWRGGSLRPLKRMIETILAGRHAFAARH